MPSDTDLIVNPEGQPPGSVTTSLVSQAAAVILTVLTNLSFGFAYAPRHIYEPRHLVPWFILLVLYARLYRAVYHGSNIARISLTVAMSAYVAARTHALYIHELSSWALTEGALLVVMVASIISLYLPISNGWFTAPAAPAITRP